MRTEPNRSPRLFRIRLRFLLECDIINHQVALMRFLDDGFVPIDNGLVERLYRRPGIGRRSFLFAGSHAGGERAAIAYSKTCHPVNVRLPQSILDDLRNALEGE